ncbi:MAG: pyridoxal 5'-phosphate synthase glutaminase subunit PdxT [Fusobacteriaceae bacterium]
MVIGVLALQGAFREHIDALKKLDIQFKEIRNKDDIQGIDGLIIPGGESTAIAKLLIDFNMVIPLKKLIAEGLPVFGTCAGMIILAKKLVNDDRVHLGVMDIEVKRNAYGRQLDSFKCLEKFEGIEGNVEMVFIRAPYIERVGEGVEILAKVGEDIVAAREGNLLAISFHPELTNELKIHKYFYEMCVDRIKE